MPIAELQAVTKSYASPGGGPERVVLDQFQLTIEEGESVAIMGPSGCGKSTILNLLGTLDRPTSGKVTLFGQEVSPLSEKALAAFRAEKIGFIFQHHHLLPQLTVLENVLVPTLALPKSHAARQDSENRAKELLKRVGLGQHFDHRPAQLSGGERQRAAVVRALINRPKVLLADEPTGALDATNAASLLDLLLQFNKEDSLTLVVVTHDPIIGQQLSRVVDLRLC